VDTEGNINAVFPRRTNSAANLGFNLVKKMSNEIFRHNTKRYEASMKTLTTKMTVEEIRQRFDGEVERFSNLAVGQTTTVDATTNLALLAEAATRCTPKARRVLDIGCGAGNATLSLLHRINSLDCDLLDLSNKMLHRAQQRVSAETTGVVRIIQADFRSADLPRNHYDVVLAATVLHHLREDNEWQEGFATLYDLLAPGGSLWITDLIEHENDEVQGIMWNRYGDYLVQTAGEEARDRCFKEIEVEDTPRPLTYQLELLRKCGFRQIDVLHKNACFATFGAVK
jgi:tRNA (cmo5U34)-methyltransferase